VSKAVHELLPVPLVLLFVPLPAGLGADGTLKSCVACVAAVRALARDGDVSVDAAPVLPEVVLPELVLPKLV